MDFFGLLATYQDSKHGCGDWLAYTNLQRTSIAADGTFRFLKEYSTEKNRLILAGLKVRFKMFAALSFSTAFA